MQVIVEGLGLLEAARWYPERGLVFSDMTLGGVFCLKDSQPPLQVLVPHRKGIGGLVAHRDGGLVVAGRNVAHKMPDGSTTILLETGPDEQFFNDLTADSRGRLYVGSVGLDSGADDADEHRPDGRLYRLALDGSTTVLADDVLVSNGLGHSPADDILYHVDSHRHTVWAFDDNGGREQFADTTEYPGFPDGLAIAADGSVWVAIAGAGLVVAWSADGRRIEEVEVGQKLVTSLCFGGPALRSLFILTGCNDDHPDEQGGSVYVHDVERAGLPAPHCAVPVPVASR